MEHVAITSESSDFLFAYGTLGPKDSDEARRDGWTADHVLGRLFDLGPYPGLVDVGREGARWISGSVRPVSERELRERLDPYEGVSDGLYQRITTTTRSGSRVWVYVYARPIPKDAKELTARWRDEREPATATDFWDD